MYKLIIAFMCCFSSAYACDFCGCSPAVMNTDVLSLQPQSSVGIGRQCKTNANYNAIFFCILCTQEMGRHTFINTYYLDV